MSLYQGRALERAAKVRRPRRRGMQVIRVLAVLAVVAVALQLPWRDLRKRFAVVTDVDVQGAHYLDPARVQTIAGLKPGADLIRANLDRARQRLLLHPRIAAATVARDGARGIRIAVTEREPVLLVPHGVPWEIDSSGVLLAPLAEGVVADVPLLHGFDTARLPAGTQLVTPEVRRGLAWVRALRDRELALAGDVSEIDVSDARATGILLMSGTRVLTPAWPPDVRTLSALRVVLADLQHRGTTASEVDMRFANQVIVRPVPAAPPVGGVTVAAAHRHG